MSHESGKGETAKVANDMEKIDINVFHKQMGHMSEAMTRQLARRFGYTLTGEFNVCQACAEAKAKQKLINKTTNIEERKDWNPGEKLWMDVSSTKHTSYGGAKFWFLIVDDKTDYCWSYFLKKKNELSEKLENLVMKLKSFGIKIKKI